jgi:cold shock CspA family protein
MATGRVVRFDEIRGYGFITPDGGGEDVFLHVNDLEVDKNQIKRGTRVVFDVEEGDRGKFAVLVRVAAEPHVSPGGVPADVEPVEYYHDLTTGEFRSVVTEILLHVTRPLSGDQIVEVRNHFEKLANEHGWLEP